MTSTIPNNTVPNIKTSTEQGLYINPTALAECLPAISYQEGILHIEGVSSLELAKEYGTPCYVYSRPAIINAYHAYVDSLQDIDHQVCYAVKACSNIAVLNALAKEGAGFDIVSIGELARVLKAGGEASKVVYSGVGKTASDIQYALEKGVGCFNVEAISELDLIHEVATTMGKVAKISLRINPNVDAKTHPYISTGLKENKFGIMHEDAVSAYQHAKGLSGLKISGIDCHIGSQLTDTKPFEDALDKLIELINELKAVGIEFDHIDLGGGLGVQYIDENVAPTAELMALLLPKIKELGLSLWLEPGRSIVANAGVLLTNVDVLKASEKEGGFKNFAIVDAAMNDLIRPALYQSEMAVIPTVLTITEKTHLQTPSNSPLSGGGHKAWEIVGSICETGDFLAKSRLLDLSVGDTLAITGAGAYGFTMASNYNTRPRACEVMVDGGKHGLIRKRETVEELYKDEVICNL